MFKLIICGFAALTLSVSAYAQEIDEERLALAHELLKLSGVEALTEQAMEATMPTLLPGIQQQYPGASIQQYNEAIAILSEALLAAVPEIISASAEIYARRFTADELRDINAFYRTETGRKMVAEQPAMLAEITQISERLGLTAALSVNDEVQAGFLD